ncbi:MAG: pseudouridine-5'-phosphate glycosidase [Chloroflexota bacterium]
MTVSRPDWLVVADEVATALAERRPVVALESSLISQGLPAPHNLETARAAEAAVRDEGAVPATVAVADGRVVVGAGSALLDRLADPAQHPFKAASRDLGPLLAGRRLAATTVSATMRAAHAAGIALFATGGIGGVHRGAATSWDVSSDLDELAATPVAVVCSGAKSILDLPATLEALETRRVPVVGFGTDRMPAFLSPDAGLAVPHRVDDPEAAAAVVRLHLALPGAGGLLIVQPPPADVSIPADEVDGWIADAVAAADRDHVTGGRVTPYVLSHVAQASGGRTLRANVALIINNARTAARIAVALAERDHRSTG